MVVETMRREGLSHLETERQFELPDKRAASWKRIYLEEGSEGLYIKRRGRGSKSRSPKPDRQLQEFSLSVLLSIAQLPRAT